LPDIKTQSSIARILSSLDDKIELNNKINKELDKLARTIYDYWFVNNEISKKWKREKIVNLIKSGKNGDWGKETKQGRYTEKVTCIRGTDINSFAGNNEIKAPERYILEKNKNKFLVDGDIVIEISGGSPTQSTGRVAYILDEILEGFENPLICSNFCKVISLKDQDLFYYFIFAWKQLYENGIFFGYEGKTSGLKNFLFDNFVNSYEMIIPPTNMLRQFREVVSPIFSKVIKNRQESANLAQFRDFLLPLLMNGQVIVKSSKKAYN
jgi:type I restriction enzyme S subunit